MLEEIIAVLNDITGADAGEITPETELFEEGLLDSFGLVELLGSAGAVWKDAGCGRTDARGNFNACQDRGAARLNPCENSF